MPDYKWWQWPYRFVPRHKSTRQQNVNGWTGYWWQNWWQKATENRANFPMSLCRYRNWGKGGKWEKESDRQKRQRERYWGRRGWEGEESERAIAERHPKFIIMEYTHSFARCTIWLRTKWKHKYLSENYEWAWESQKEAAEDRCLRPVTAPLLDAICDSLNMLALPWRNGQNVSWMSLNLNEEKTWHDWIYLKRISLDDLSSGCMRS